MPLPRVLGATEFRLPPVDGFHLPDGRVFALHGCPDGDFRVAAQASPPAPADDIGFATLYPSFETRHPDGHETLVGGDGAWEGEGFLALIDLATQTPTWIFYCATAEIFISGTFGPHCIRAVSLGDIHRYHWSFDRVSPPTIRIERSRA
ncbi:MULTISPECIES: hypothetical protein [Lysobacter]|uniref:hypothetical protein n=1 Tax=Lysobacter TaxID=68 RepID=UPI001F33956F|nr:MULTISPECIES: hypothetical protein [Lysobacter]UJB20689.1 hypothetical protein L1A79_06330 [Lysobacter capsici]UJQ30197.1 hypothetical protein L2D09_08530 [Lysobacter gummosus]